MTSMVANNHNLPTWGSLQIDWFFQVEVCTKPFYPLSNNNALSVRSWMMLIKLQKRSTWGLISNCIFICLRIGEPNIGFLYEPLVFCSINEWVLVNKIVPYQDFRIRIYCYCSWLYFIKGPSFFHFQGNWANIIQYARNAEILCCKTSFFFLKDSVL